MKAAVILSLLLFSAPAFAENCKPVKGTENSYSSLTISTLDSEELRYTVASLIHPGEMGPGKPGKEQNFTAHAIPSTREGYVQYVDDEQSDSLSFWSSWNAPDDKITYDVQESLMEGSGGELQVWGVEPPLDNPTIDGTPGVMGSFQCD